MSETEYTYINGLLSETVSAEYEEDVTTNTRTQYENGNVKYEEIKTTTVSETEGTTVTTDKNTYAYDVYGNNTTLTTVSQTDSETETVTNTEYEYDSLGRTVRSTVLNETAEEYVYDPLGNVLLEKTTDENNETKYTRNLYDAYGRAVQEISSEYYNAEKDSVLNGSDTYSGTEGHLYEYNAQTGNLDSETNELGVKTSYTYYNGNKVTEKFDMYVFEYDSKENIEKVTVSGNLYAEYEYNSDNNPTLVTYGNTQKVRYVYDTKGNLTAQYRNNEENPYVVYEYKKSSDDEETGNQEEYFETDPEVEIETNDDYVLYSKTNYDSKQKTYYTDDKTSIYVLSGEQEKFLYSYDTQSEEKDNIFSDITHNYYDESTVSQKVDEDNKVQSYSISNVGSIAEFDYSFSETEKTDSTSAYASSKISVKKTNGDTEEITSTDIISTKREYDDIGNVAKEIFTANGNEYEYTYEYDDKGRLKQLSATDNGGIRYWYDSKGQVVREDTNLYSNTSTNEYVYDSRGNLTNYNVYSYSPGDKIYTNTKRAESKKFTYNSSDNSDVWHDELVDMQGADGRYLYDINGNPVELNSVKLRWTNGRNLEAVYYTDEKGEDIDLVTYTYDEKGIRTSKSYPWAEMTTHYTNIDGNITSEYTLDENDEVYNKKVYLYNESNEIIGYTDDVKTYFYIRNYLGDVIGICDEDGTLLLKYAYDAWGTSTIMTENIPEGMTREEVRAIGENNTIRYRGYYFDVETEFYYLQSRYYDSGYCRFINSDLPEYAQIGKDDYAGTNLFVYCLNDPVNNTDPTGHWVLSIGAEVQGSAIFGFYGGISINFDGHGNIVFAYCAGVQFSTNVAASACLFANVYSNGSAKSIKGWDIGYAISYSLGIHLSHSAGFSASINSKSLNALQGLSYGKGCSLAPVPYISIKGGYTGILYSTTFNKVFNWKKNKTHKYSKKGVKIKITNKKNCIIIYINSLKRTVRIYKNGKFSISKKG